MENTNLELYEKVRQPPKDALTGFDNGSFKGTDINTMWRIKTLTEQYGPCGVGWYFTPERKWTETAPNGSIMAFADINLYIKHNGEWSKPIAGTGGNKFAKTTKSGCLQVSDECFKMAVTDALGNACRSLGLGADVYWANDKTKYTEEDAPTKTPKKTGEPTEDERAIAAAKLAAERENLIVEYTTKIRKLKGDGALDVQAYYQKRHDGKSIYEAALGAIKSEIKLIDAELAKLDPTA